MIRCIFVCTILLLLACNSPRHRFEKSTGLTIKAPVLYFLAKDTYGIIEGEYSVVLKTTKDQIDQWLKNTPPWENRKWSKGPVPAELGANAQFNFPRRVGYGIDRDGKTVYSGDKNLAALLNDPATYYVFKELCCPDKEGLRFHDGCLLILQPTTQMVYYSNWNY